jgi:uncharacterized membrane protein
MIRGDYFHFLNKGVIIFTRFVGRRIHMLHPLKRKSYMHTVLNFVYTTVFCVMDYLIVCTVMGVCFSRVAARAGSSSGPSTVVRPVVVGARLW